MKVENTGAGRPIEFNGQDDSTRVARGFVYGVCFSVALWLIAGATFWLI